MAVQICKYTKNNGNIYFKWVNCMVCEFYHLKTFFFKNFVLVLKASGNHWRFWSRLTHNVNRNLEKVTGQSWCGGRNSRNGTDRNRGDQGEEGVQSPITCLLQDARGTKRRQLKPGKSLEIIRIEGCDIRKVWNSKEEESGKAPWERTEIRGNRGESAFRNQMWTGWKDGNSSQQCDTSQTGDTGWELKQPHSPRDQDQQANKYNKGIIYSLCWKGSIHQNGHPS